MPKKPDMTPIGGKAYVKPIASVQKTKAKSSSKSIAKPKPTLAAQLEEALQLLRSLGYAVTPATTAQDAERHEASLAKLGLTESKKVAKPVAEPTTLTTVLGTTHVIAGQVYGPGLIELPLTEQALFNSLIYQDQLSRRAHMDTTVFTTANNCYIIERGTGADRHNHFHKRPVSEAHFNSDAAFEASTAVTAGSQDVAGRMPNPTHF